ncbi:hypothetical protein THAOC_26803, partial [Thalassiosira oceanica]
VQVVPEPPQGPPGRRPPPQLGQGAVVGPLPGPEDVAEPPADPAQGRADPARRVDRCGRQEGQHAEPQEVGSVDGPRRGAPSRRGRPGEARVRGRREGGQRRDGRAAEVAARSSARPAARRRRQRPRQRDEQRGEDRPPREADAVVEPVGQPPPRRPGRTSGSNRGRTARPGPGGGRAGPTPAGPRGDRGGTRGCESWRIVASLSCTYCLGALHHAIGRPPRQVGPDARKICRHLRLRFPSPRRAPPNSASVPADFAGVATRRVVHDPQAARPARVTAPQGKNWAGSASAPVAFGSSRSGSDCPIFARGAATVREAWLHPAPSSHLRSLDL